MGHHLALKFLFLVLLHFFWLNLVGFMVLVSGLVLSLAEKLIFPAISVFFLIVWHSVLLKLQPHVLNMFLCVCSVVHVSHPSCLLRSSFCLLSLLCCSIAVSFLCCIVYFSCSLSFCFLLLIKLLLFFVVIIAAFLVLHLFLFWL